ncbi:MAG: hypothetical protein A3I07_02360 [Candidatus Doudnabacteria bacterium RIFCSPLOWO2_02_FULL_42_9]|uniref:Uncharacterized protein n=1 Tax=Candidatus Doudnabacteria bacterium RIFCSPHIGHO2_01_FULL_41_86 TaxID=1817821 RepID=A0A1F5N7J2_9BACT|nr:MAG: hypothetical protein A2717_03070 [Candidatus Doudnabacteria bacterium RIFCSPHIGHO2_01_FULL_41_86]OGE74676.1 MAG: hypothetical protein A3K07_02665 [Candidatus Doudnabacteria bacterium RIFCSPHIGHO2_01_43_10]OGE85035.1 MAG: hypothetical protein A3E28_04475 [Candidatus Doudnabacteria bacterium RIFCSPHIGHO2_12_FULL_42_22]OGE86476.1 MAG: hypothetical protein A3C49_04655 [Candidatus Doudnabacteria bacterium RIFCSPHIGHO2_02_FULL_42_25]OGE91938.1 MAG: hypothetical protein A2895_01420 [Candidatus
MSHKIIVDFSALLAKKSEWQGKHEVIEAPDALEGFERLVRAFGCEKVKIIDLADPADKFVAWSWFARVGLFTKTRICSDPFPTSPDFRGLAKICTDYTHVVTAQTELLTSLPDSSVPYRYQVGLVSPGLVEPFRIIPCDSWSNAVERVIATL